MQSQYYRKMTLPNGSDDEVKEHNGLDDEVKEDTVTLVSSDNTNFVVTHEHARKSRYLHLLLDEDPSVQSINLDITHAKLLKIVDFMVHNVDEVLKIPEPLQSNDIDEFLDDYQKQFINSLTTEELCQLIKDAHYLEYSLLVHMLCAKLASMIKGKDFNVIQQILNF